MNDKINESLASIVTANPSAARVLEKFQLDYCCGGKKELSEACREKGLEPSLVLGEIDNISAGEYSENPSFESMNPGQLIDHIVRVHHHYVLESLPAIQAHLSKVVAKHGERFPYMKEVEVLFAQVADEMVSHLQKEENILFPLIRRLGESDDGRRFGAAKMNLEGPIRQMLSEHEDAGEALARIRSLTSDYSIPAHACRTFTICLYELREFTEDLHAHVHLENNILFVKALAMAA